MHQKTGEHTHTKNNRRANNALIFTKVAGTYLYMNAFILHIEIVYKIYLYANLCKICIILNFITYGYNKADICLQCIRIRWVKALKKVAQSTL